MENVTNEESLAFAKKFADIIEADEYEKDCLPNNGFPMNINYAKERLLVFDAVLNGEGNDSTR